jgi:lycopene cyclase CruP
MEYLGDDVLRPFLQDVVQFPALSRTLFQTSISHPQVILPIIPQVGINTLLNWLVNYINLGIYSSLYPLGKSLASLGDRLSPKQQYYYHQLLQAWKYGTGADYHQ